VLALQEVVDFTLGRAACRDGSGVGGASFFDGGTGGLDLCFLSFDLFLQSFDARVAGQVVEALGGNEDIGLDVVHEVGETFRGFCAAGLCVGRKGVEAAARGGRCGGCIEVWICRWWFGGATAGEVGARLGRCFIFGALQDFCFFSRRLFSFLEVSLRTV
jgi:hypothetical protein